MKTKNLALITVLMIIPVLGIMGQSGVVLTGGDTGTGEYMVSYSIGTTLYTSFQQEGYTVSLGLQHPEIKIMTQVPFLEDPKLEISFSPNPVHEWLQVKIKEPESTDIILQLVSVTGKVVFEGRPKYGQLRISMAGLGQGSYFLIVKDQGPPIKSYHIIKQ